MTHSMELMMLIDEALPRLRMSGHHFLVDGIEVTIVDPTDEQEYTLTIKPKVTHDAH